MSAYKVFGNKDLAKLIFSQCKGKGLSSIHDIKLFDGVETMKKEMEEHKIPSICDQYIPVLYKIFYAGKRCIRKMIVISLNFKYQLFEIISIQYLNTILVCVYDILHKQPSWEF